MNWYAYCGGNPVIYIDFYGLYVEAELQDDGKYKITDMDGNKRIASARDIGNYGAGYVAGANGLSYGLARFASVNTFINVLNRWKIEAKQTRAAQKFGFDESNYRGSQK